jgi:MYXO-CTERM domain-containing protein
MQPRPLASAAFLVLALSPRPALADDVRKGPYLLHLGTTSVDLRLELGAAEPVTVDVTADALPAPPVAPGPSSKPATPAARPAPPVTFASPAAPYHSVHLTGLAPATRYRYAVRVGVSAPRTGTFTTAPLDSSHEPFTFVVYGDNRSDGPAHERVVTAIAKESFDFLVNTGDFVIAGADESAWQSFFDVEEPLLRDHCLFACIGNHELAADRAATHFARYLGPTEPVSPGGAATPLYGTFRWGRARFFLLNAFDDFSAMGPERAWLDDALAKADTEPGLDLRVAVIHHGPHSAGVHGDNERLADAHFDASMRAHHVDLVLSGHDHIYERGEADGLKYVVTGGGGAPLYEEIHRTDSTRKAEAAYNYVVATVKDDVVSIVTKRPDGSVLDQCSFARGGSWLCDPKKAPQAKAAPVEKPAPAQAGSSCGCHGAGKASEPAFGALFGLALAGAAARRRR